MIEIICHKKTDRKIKRLKRSCVVNGRKQAHPMMYASMVALIGAVFLMGNFSLLSKFTMCIFSAPEI